MTDEIKNNHDAEEPEEDFAAMLEASLGGKAAPKLEPGQKIRAKILAFSGDWVFLDVGQKGEGVLERKEVLDEQGQPTVAVGDVLDVYFVSRAGGELRFALRLAATGRSDLEEAWKSGIPVDGRVEKEIKGGFEVRLAGQTRAFCPFSQMGLRRTEAPEEWLGRTLPFRITQYGEQGRNIVVSHRALLEEEREQQRAQLRDTLHEGMRVRGTVTSLRDFGAFVDIGGVEGLLPISEIAWGRVEDIREALHEGQEIEVCIKSIDWDKNRFSFSRRDTLADPWEEAARNFAEGSRHLGRVVRLAPFGAFVTLGEGVDGLVHISKLGGGKRINHPREVLKEGQELEVLVEKIDHEARRISLALAAQEAAEPGEADLRAYLEQDSGAGLGTLGDLLKKAQQPKKHKKGKK
ncbi:30S ribosomal protein S1 [Geoalkalibacter halelectricus]|uniref:30S ribosomal protein S1 n=1 Tax=Geoalkalibacter halelectricus TaxID=2847045 RepID=A0ABY5ZLM0_9BACT|nr:30S ribosomal protein S1 [Geoalkalibacter halelectricus]MDO3378724.1 30S ribosomal protein S1 [Geoalkalibacter halelectricus]UWZ79968.1 30S ribosomal protein S1 [Geoalkalibacter halelectricus]